MGKIDCASRSAGRQICILQLPFPIISHFGNAPSQSEDPRARPPCIPLRLSSTDEACD